MFNLSQNHHEITTFPKITTQYNWINRTEITFGLNKYVKRPYYVLNNVESRFDRAPETMKCASLKPSGWTKHNRHMGPTTSRSDPMVFDRANLGNSESVSDCKARCITSTNYNHNANFSTFAVPQESGWTRGEKTRDRFFIAFTLSYKLKPLILLNDSLKNN